MEKNREKSVFRSVWLWMFEGLLGILLMGSVFVIAANQDMEVARGHLSATANYIKEQCNQYNRLTLASETKSLMRVMESARYIKKQLDYWKNINPSFALNEDVLKQMAEDNYVSGMFILDTSGTILEQYHSRNISAQWLEAHLDSGALLNTVWTAEKTYSTRCELYDGSYIDLAAVGTADREKIIVPYYYTPAEYNQAFNLNIDSLLSGYSLEHDGTIVVSSGEKIVSSNDEILIGKSTNDIEILRKIKEQANCDKLVHAKRDSSSLSQNFGLMEHGRKYYVYAYMPERDVFDHTLQYVFYSLILYVIILIAINMVRWRTAQGYREDQMRIQAEYTESLQKKNEQLKNAVAQADKANAAKTSFLSRMSHDIRTPLNGIIGLLEIDEAHRDDLDLILENQKKMKISANHLLSLINDILQMSKLESGEIVLAEEPMNLKKLSDDVLTIVEQRAAEAGITLKYDKTTERVAYQNVYGSPLHVRQIFLNIYGNCIKYNKVGGEVETSCVCLHVTDDKVTYRWTIRDTGVGMSKEFLSHIFDPFAQEKADARSVHNGTGLGMSIVKSLIDKMGGTIEISSEEGVGSIFVITLSFKIAEAEDLPEEKNEPEKQESVAGLHLLLAEDNELNAEIIETLLNDEGVTVTIARDGQQAIDQFLSNPPGTYAAILMDVMMPVTDGLAATKAIRSFSREDAKTIPIIALTANAFDEDMKQCLEAGMNAHLSKPLQMDMVVTTLVKYCR